MGNMEYDIKIEDFDFKKNDDGEIEVWVPWNDNDENSPMFLIKEVSLADRQMLLQNSRKKSPKKLRDSGDDDLSFNNVDFPKFNRSLLRLCVVGWKNLKNNNLAEILDPKGKWQYKGEPDSEGKYDGKFDIEFSVDVKREIADNYSADFIVFVNNVHNFINELAKKDRERHLKN